jgi:cysteine synthase B
VGLQPDLPMHGLEGWKHLETAIVPGIYDPELADEIFTVSTEEAYDLIRKISKQHQVLLSPSSAANIAGAIKLAGSIQEGNIVTLLPDNADKYLDLIQKIL